MVSCGLQVRGGGTPLLSAMVDIKTVLGDKIRRLIEDIKKVLAYRKRSQGSP